MSDLVFLQETKCSIENIKEVNRKLGRRFTYLEVESQSIAGGLVTQWNPQVLNLLDAESIRFFLSMEMKIIRVPWLIMVTNVYGPRRIDEKLSFIQVLKDLKDRKFHLPWLQGGDFNMIASLPKKKGGQRCTDKDSKTF